MAGLKGKLQSAAEVPSPTAAKPPEVPKLALTKPPEEPKLAQTSQKQNTKQLKDIKTGSDGDYTWAYKAVAAIGLIAAVGYFVNSKLLKR